MGSYNKYFTCYEFKQLKTEKSAFKRSSNQPIWPYYQRERQNGLDFTCVNIPYKENIKSINKEHPATKERIERFSEWCIFIISSALRRRAFGDPMETFTEIRERIIKDYYAYFRFGITSGKVADYEKWLVNNIIGEELKVLARDMRGYINYRRGTHPHLFTSKEKAVYSAKVPTVVISDSTPFTPQQRSRAANGLRSIDDKNIDIEMFNKLSKNPFKYVTFGQKNNLTDYDFFDVFFDDYNKVRRRNGRPKPLSKERIKRRMRDLILSSFGVKHVVDALNIIVLPHKLNFDNNPGKRTRKFDKLGKLNESKLEKASLLAFGSKKFNPENIKEDNFDLIDTVEKSDKTVVTFRHVTINKLVYKDSYFINNKDTNWYSEAFVEMNPDIVGPNGKGFKGRVVKHAWDEAG